ncbi:hypothetical protein HanIR_Chr16g0815621 [Helianthus annuus]|uniref:Uncharacterized protein n=1 Tax=Helianthus annuus TaxID=4232 RepID=A0A251RZS8_HELAN|nr:hypothetical protein HanIR_Chr16g0815621 [Helianthus annuus]
MAAQNDLCRPTSEDKSEVEHGQVSYNMAIGEFVTVDFKPDANAAQIKRDDRDANIQGNGKETLLNPILNFEFFLFTFLQ